MPRRRRYIVPGLPLHVVQRGVNRQQTFYRARDFRAYLDGLEATSRHYAVNIHAYVLMSNHTHLLMTAADPVAASRMMQQLGRHYATHFNKTRTRTGPLWDGRFRSSAICTERYLFACYRYIELNPVRAGLVAWPEDYPWTSYRFNALGEQSGWIQPRPEWLALGRDDAERCRRYRNLFLGVTAHLDDEKLRVSTRKGIETR